MLSSADISTTQTSDTTIVEGIDEASILVQWSGTSPVGTITIEASNSTENEFKKNLEVWETLDFSATISVSGNTGSHQILLNSLPFRAIRFIYTASSGTGSLTAHINASSIGA